MIRGRTSLAIAVRRPDNNIEVTSRPLAALYKGNWRNLFLIRGIIALIETVALGTSALMYSAQVAGETEEEKITPGMLWGSVVLGVLIAVVLFFILPLLLVRVFDSLIASAFISNILEGIVRIIFFVTYLAAIGRMKDIREIFACHGAEHMAVNALESGLPLTIDNVKRNSTAHVRCGTSFLLVVLLVAIVVFALLGRPPLWIGIVSRVLLIPVIAAVSYEIIKFEANYADNLIVRWLMAPGLWLQAMTTRRPSEGQIEVAIAALSRAIEADGLTPAVSGYTAN